MSIICSSRMGSCTGTDMYPARSRTDCMSLTSAGESSTMRIFVKRTNPCHWYPYDYCNCAAKARRWREILIRQTKLLVSICWRIVLVLIYEQRNEWDDVFCLILRRILSGFGLLQPREPPIFRL